MAENRTQTGSYNGPYTTAGQPMPTFGATAKPPGPTPSGMDGTRPLTGWAATQNFNPTSLNQLYEAPWAILPRIFSGMTPSSPGYQMMRDFGADPLALFTMTEGANRITSGGAGELANYLAQMFRNAGSAGGTAFNATELLRNIMNAQTKGPTVNGMPTPAQTSLGQMLGVGDPSQQARTLYNLVRDVAGVAMNPLAGQGFEAAMLQLLDTFQNRSLSQNAGDMQSPNAFVRQVAPWMAGQY